MVLYIRVSQKETVIYSSIMKNFNSEELYEEQGNRETENFSSLEKMDKFYVKGGDMDIEDEPPVFT